MYQFEWDSGNLHKLDQVRSSGRDYTGDEIESVFADPKRLVLPTKPDPISQELRYITFGISNRNRVLSVIFVVRNGVIRVFNVWKTKGTKLKQYHGKD